VTGSSGRTLLHADGSLKCELCGWLLCHRWYFGHSAHCGPATSWSGNQLLWHTIVFIIPNNISLTTSSLHTHTHTSAHAHNTHKTHTRAHRHKTHAHTTHKTHARTHTTIPYNVSLVTLLRHISVFRPSFDCRPVDHTICCSTPQYAGWLSFPYRHNKNTSRQFLTVWDQINELLKYILTLRLPD